MVYELSIQRLLHDSKLLNFGASSEGTSTFVEHQLTHSEARLENKDALHLLDIAWLAPVGLGSSSAHRDGVSAR